MVEIIGAIFAILSVIAIYVYYGRKALDFIRKLLLGRNVKKHLELLQAQQILGSMSKEELKGYNEYVKARVEKEKQEKRKGIFRF
jgi:hypothetical protein